MGADITAGDDRNPESSALAPSFRSAVNSSAMKNRLKYFKLL